MIQILHTRCYGVLEIMFKEQAEFIVILQLMRYMQQDIMQMEVQVLILQELQLLEIGRT